MDYVELAIKSGDFMAMDRVFLKNRLAAIITDKEKLAYIMPPASVVNAYFSEIYEKQGPDAAMAYFLTLSTTFESFSELPNFDLEGSTATPTLRIIRLNLLGKSFGLVYKNTDGEALIFSELADETLSDTLLFEIAKLFPEYVVTATDSNVTLAKVSFDPFSAEEELTDLTRKSENKTYTRVTTLNIADGLACYETLLKNCEKTEKMIQFKHREFNLYLRK